MDDVPVASLDSVEQVAEAPAEDVLVPEPEVEVSFVADAAEIDMQAAAPEQARQSLWQRLRRLTGMGRPDAAELEMRLADLNRAIEKHPDAAMNYVLRGELYLEARDYQQASVDFEQALALASHEVSTADWGIIAQVVQDRALQGLRFVVYQRDFRTMKGALTSIMS